MNPVEHLWDIKHSLQTVQEQNDALIEATSSLLTCAGYVTGVRRQMEVRDPIKSRCDLCFWKFPEVGSSCDLIFECRIILIPVFAKTMIWVSLCYIIDQFKSNFF